MNMWVSGLGKGVYCTHMLITMQQFLNSSTIVRSMSNISINSMINISFILCLISFFKLPVIEHLIFKTKTQFNANFFVQLNKGFSEIPSVSFSN